MVGKAKIFMLATATMMLAGCAFIKPRKSDTNALFATGSTEKQVIRVMGSPAHITLKDDTEYWHYGRSWVAFLNNKVVKYENHGSLRVAKLDSEGNPAGMDIPDVPPPQSQPAQPPSSVQTPPTPSGTAKSKIAELEDAIQARRSSPDSFPRQLKQRPLPDQFPPINDAPTGQWVN